MNSRVRILISGRVQGVFFRDSTREKAQELGVTGWVRNRPSGEVEVVAEGPRDLLEALVSSCGEGPTFARVDNLDVEWQRYLAEFVGFKVTG